MSDTVFFPPENGFCVQVGGLYVTTIKKYKGRKLQWSPVKPAEQNPSKNLSLTFQNPTFSINRKQNTFVSYCSCDGSIAIQNELKFETFSVPSINLETLGSTKSSPSLKFKRQSEQLCDQPQRAAARRSKIL